MTLSEFKKRFAKLRQQGFVRSARSGPTGIGHTLELALGLKENNLAVPDLGEVELKAHRENAASLVTLFTFNRKAWVLNPLEAVRKYGTVDANGRKGLYFTMSITPTSTGLFLRITDESVWVQHTSGEILLKWDVMALVGKLQHEMPAVVMVSALSERRSDAEYLWFLEARFLRDVSSRSLVDQLRYGPLRVSLKPRFADSTLPRGYVMSLICPDNKIYDLFRFVEVL
jgi:hypothetical protein